jgi:predicted AlkP superfamily pyrophosphatase or phosphodiesterase
MSLQNAPESEEEATSPRRLLAYSLLIFVLLLAGLSGATPQGAPAAPETVRRPKLVIVLIIDQLRYDYLVRFRPQFVERGFNLLLSGANFVNCRYDYAVTATGPGHATLLTGAYPDIHGIVENSWYDRSLGREVYCTEDLASTLVESATGPTNQRGGSPKNLQGSTLGDELRMASDFKSKVIAVSLKDRAAILPGGHTANAAYWFKSSTGHFVSGTYYMNSLPDWVARFNESSPAKNYCGKSWQALPETPGASGKTFRELSTAPGAPCPDRKFLEAVNASPFISEIELKFAGEAIRNERLGQGSATDLLTISLSANDYVGHEFGPYSLEVADMTLRTDRYLADFFAEVDRMVGLDNVWIALSADHGVAPTPAFVKEHKLGMGWFRGELVKQAVDSALTQAFGRDQWILSAGIPYLYLNQAAIAKRQIAPERVETEAARAAALVPGVKAAFTRTQLLTGAAGQSSLARKAAHAFESHRSGDVFLILDPFAVPSDGETDTTHGAMWNYDAQVPLVLWGSAFRPGVYALPCETIDLAPTMAAALGLTQPSGAQGHPLTQALRAR